MQGILKDITWDMFFPVGDHISLGIMCFPVRETDITKKQRMNGH